MISPKLVTLWVLFHALLSLSEALGNAAQPQHSAGQRGGSAATHRNSPGSTQGKHQWSADPERGWVRRDETHEANHPRSTPKQRNQGSSRSSKDNGRL